MEGRTQDCGGRRFPPLVELKCVGAEICRPPNVERRMPPLPRLVKNVAKRPYRFLVEFKDGRTEEITVEAESYHSAILSLPVGKKAYISLDK